MNNLSWFIYLTQVSDSARDASSAFMIASSIVVGILFIFAPLIAMMVEDIDGLATIKAKIPSALKMWGILFCVAALFYLTMPSRQTMILIAGSEMGERIVKSDAVKDIVNPGADLLKAWIKDETDKITSKKK